MIINYLELVADFQLPPAEAILYHQQKGLKQTFSWADMIGQEHDGAFTVAKMMDNDLLAKVRDSVDIAINEGATLADFKKHLIPELQKAGWWGKQDVIDPKTGRVVRAQLGSASRLETIFRTNLQTAYSVGHWEGIESAKAVLPYLMYDAVDDTRTRQSHAKWDETTLPVSSPFWDQFMPPNGWNCRCGVIQMDAEDIEDEGLTLSKEPKVPTRKWTNPRDGITYTVPIDIDPGFNRNPGKYRLASIDAAAAEKLAQMTSEQKAVMARVDVIASRANQEARQALKNDELLKALSIANAEGALDRHMERFNAKLPDVQAQKAIDAALDDATPYLAAAIKKVQGTKAAQNMSPKEILEKAQEQAATKQKGVAIDQYTKAMVAGKQPNAKAQAVVDSLPDDEQLALAKQIDDLTGETAAKAELAKIADGNADAQAALKQKALEKASNDGTAQGMTAKQLLAKVEADAEAQYQKKQLSSNISGYKKKVLAGKLPTPTQQAAWDSLDDAEKGKHLADIEAKQQALQEADTAAAAPTQAEPLRMENMTQIGPQKGSNEGGLYQDKETGRKYYIKTPASEDMARNEVLAAKLYQAAGIDAPEYHLISDNGTTRIASEFIEGLNVDAEALKDGIPGAREGFAADAWLANWDVVGLGYDNLLVKAGKAYRIDTGGALRYRAQGGIKGDAFGVKVLELDTLRDVDMNAQSASVFGNVTPAEIEAGLRKIARIDAEHLADLVEEFGPTDPAERFQLLVKLRARREYLLNRYPNARQTEAPEPKAETPKKGLAPMELQKVESAGIEGYTVLVDKEFIEDHNVRVTYLKGEDGQLKTRVTLKATPAGMDRIAEVMPDAPKPGRFFDIDQAKATALEAVKGINYQVQNAHEFREKDRLRIEVALEVIAKTKLRVSNSELTSAKQAQVQANLDRWAALLEQAGQDNTVGHLAKPTGNLDLVTVNKHLNLDEEPEQTRTLDLTQMEFNFEQARFDQGQAQLTGQTFAHQGGRPFIYQENGERLVYFGKDAQLAARGIVSIEVPGTGNEAYARAMALIEDLELDTDRAKPEDRELLYLNQTAWAMTIKSPSAWKKYQALTTRDDRLKFINKIAKRDISKDPNYLREMRGNQDSGRVSMLRADFDPDEFREFTKEHRLYHDLTFSGGTVLDKLRNLVPGGGSLASLTDRLRRGVSASAASATADYSSGGGSYVFMRLRNNTRAPGLYWKTEKHLRRTDRISYDHDAYGKVEEDYQRRKRKDSLAEMKQAAVNSGNETIFKDSLSIFDDLDVIVVPNQSERRQIIQLFIDNGYARWPDGRELSEVIKTNY